MNPRRPAETYHGRDGYLAKLVTCDSQRLDPWHSRCTIDYGEEEFSWGDRSPGAKQLAMSILLQETGSASAALALHLPFTEEVILVLPPDRWQLSGDVVRAWITHYVESKGRKWPTGRNGERP